jgi:hypothetical protein
MEGRQSRVRALARWAGLTEPDPNPAMPAPWNAVARAWVVAYLGWSVIPGGVFLLLGALAGEGFRWPSLFAAPLIGAVWFTKALGGGFRSTRSCPEADRERVRTWNLATAVTLITLLVTAIIGYAFFHQASGWIRFATTLATGIPACVAFVAATHVLAHRIPADPGRTTGVPGAPLFSDAGLELPPARRVRSDSGRLGGELGSPLFSEGDASEHRHNA